MSLTDAQIEIMEHALCCPKCGAYSLWPEKQYGASLTLPAEWLVFCAVVDDAKNGKCGWRGSVRVAVEAALKRAGIEVAEPWRSDAPPTTEVEIIRRVSMMSWRTSVYRDGNDQWRSPAGEANFGVLGTDWCWRPIGPNPFDAKQ